MHNIVVVGCGRSGTSAVAGTFGTSGYFTGRRGWESDPWNPRGYFEDLDALKLNERILGAYAPPPLEVLGRGHPATRAATHGQYWLAHLPLEVEVAPDEALLSEMARCVEVSPYCLKDPQLCFTLPAWRPLLSDARFICVFRHPLATARSLVRMCGAIPHLQPLGVDEAWALGTWRHCYRHVLERHRHVGDWLFLHFDQLFEAEGMDRLRRHADFEGLQPFVDPALRRSPEGGALDGETRALYGTLCDLAEAGVR
ncbi:MAG: sulfotransferase [Alphaproteobacteria bacterium]|nr:sulfotransferase [Alphaproteobacteria bacterium]